MEAAEDLMEDPEDEVLRAQTASAKKPHERLVLTDGDLEIFRLIYEYRFLRRDEISALTGRPPKRLHRRLLKLVQNRYLSVIRRPQQKHIYALARAALPVLVEQGRADPEILTQRLWTHELKPLFLNHETMLVDIHVMLTLAGRNRELRPVAWKEGAELHDSVMVSLPDGIRRLPIRPDAFFTLEDSQRPAEKNKARFFLEADRSTTTQARFSDKIRAYWHYLEQGLHTKKFGIKRFRVLTITLTNERAENLCQLAASILPERARKYFLFASLKQFSLENPGPIFDSVYLSSRSAGTDRRYPLVPTTTSAPTES